MATGVPGDPPRVRHQSGRRRHVETHIRQREPIQAGCGNGRGANTRDHPSQAVRPQPADGREYLRATVTAESVHDEARAGCVPRGKHGLAPVHAVPVVVRGEERQPRHQAKDQTGAGQPQVRTVAADARHRRRRSIEEDVRSPCPVPRQAARGVGCHHRRPVQDRRRDADGRREEFVVHVTGGGIPGRSHDRRHAEGHVAGRHGRPVP